MCKIVKSLFEGKLIAEETRKSFYSKEEPEKRFKEFQEIILKSGVNVFEQFMELMTNPQIYRKCFLFFLPIMIIISH